MSGPQPDRYAHEVYADEAERLALLMLAAFQAESGDMPPALRAPILAAALGSLAMQADGLDLSKHVPPPVPMPPGGVMQRLCSVVDGWRK